MVEVGCLMRIGLPSFLTTSRVCILVLSGAAIGWPQFVHLATTGAGEQVFFVTPLRETGSDQAARFKVFSLDEDGVHLLHQPEAPYGPYGISKPSGVSVASDGTVVAYDVVRTCIGGSSCFFQELSTGYLLERSGGEPEYAGPHVRISRNGRYYAAWSSPGAMMRRPAAITDRVTGRKVTVDGLFPGEGCVASDGSSLFLTYEGMVHVSPSGGMRRLVENPGPGWAFGRMSLDDGGSTAVYETSPRRRLFVVEVDRGISMQLGPDDRDSYGATLSSNGEWVLYVSVLGEIPQLFVSRVDGSQWRQLTNSAEGVAEAALSGDGRVAWVSTREGRLLKFDITTGKSTEILAPPMLDETAGWVVPGSLIPLRGRRLGGRVEVNGREAPAFVVDRENVFAQAPWDLPEPETQSPNVVVSVARDDSPLEATTLEFRLSYAPFFPTAFISPVHQDWSGLVTPENPARPNEVLHIYAVGLGPVDCPIETGQGAPLDRACVPTTPIRWDYWWTSTDSMPAEVLFAGLAPGLVGLYQIEARVPARPPAERLKLIANEYGWHVVAEFDVR